MSDRDALLAAITAEPDEDTPRLVYADWLDEHDEGDRAEFIRVQCRLQHLSLRSAEGERLAARAGELCAKLFGHLDAVGFAGLTFRRGFVGTVTSGLLHFRDNATILTAEDAPAYEWICRWDDEEERRFEDYDFQIDVTDEVFSFAELRRCVSLDLPCMGLGPSPHVCESENLINLRRFNFPGNEAGPHIESIASRTFANLRWANFRNSDSANDCPSIVPLAECPHLANLEYLDFGECEQGDADAEAVAGAKQWNRLRHLNLSGGWFTPDGIATLFNTGQLPALAELDLSASFSEEQFDGYAMRIVGSPLLARLSKLWLCRNQITDAGVEILARCPRDVKLTLLDLSGNPIGAAGKRALRKRFGKGVCVFEEGGE